MGQIPGQKSSRELNVPNPAFLAIGVMFAGSEIDILWPRRVGVSPTAGGGKGEAYDASTIDDRQSTC